jgi:hypothetical protein
MGLELEIVRAIAIRFQLADGNIGNTRINETCPRKWDLSNAICGFRGAWFAYEPET